LNTIENEKKKNRKKERKRKETRSIATQLTMET